MELNKIYNENCLDTMSRMDSIVDLTITSPPYDNLRTYNGYSFDFENIANELYRITKPGGTVVWIVGDAVEKGSETLTSFKQAIYFKELGFNIHDTMIYEKSGFANPSSTRYHQVFEYMFILTKGKPKTFNAIKDRENKYKGVHGGEKSFRADFGMRFNIWRYNNGGGNTSKDKETFKHPAPFPEQLAEDHILSWSNEGDVVYDCFMGSGTTAKMCILNNRKYIGSELSIEYCDLANHRINKVKP
jgi:DNA modification methylase